MRRGPTGKFQTTTTVGEKVRAFIPDPLPPDPPLDLGGRLQVALERAHLALGVLDSVSTLLPDPNLFLYSYVRKEAVLSSQIEGTQSSLSDLLLFEMKAAPGAPLDDVREVSNYVAALEHGLKRVRADFPLSSRLLREVHGLLLAQGRGADKAPGEFRRSQNWIGGTRPGNALFVPPPPQEVEGCMAALERYLHARDTGVPALVRAGMAHVQFETIHPFLDGNGRVGRLLITLLLCHDGVLREPILYLSLYFKEHRKQYYDHLENVRAQGDWEAWMEFFLAGVRETADGAVGTARRLIALFQKDHGRVERLRNASSALKVLQVLKARPVVSLREASKRSDLSFPTTTTAMHRLVEMGIAKELTGRQRNRIFGYGQHLKILSEGTRPL
ncbi:MAG TPA: Fic family protein [Candidatus Polarisedimenticolia bacterium]|nr:Fic family protein [Candidatus Polarisedimenticolia bacterium]